MTGAATPIEIFRPGRFRAMHGEEIAFSDADLAAAAAAYDPALYEAPLVVGHPRVDGPAYGWTERLDYCGSRLRAHPRQVEPQFAAMVREGRFRRVSASFFRPDSPDNPKPGCYYLRHVGFLGAAAPAVQGLKPAMFGAEAQGTVSVELDFSSDAWPLARLARSLREWIIAKFGAEDADQVVPGYLAEELEAAAREPAAMDATQPSPAFGAPPAAPTAPQEDHPMSGATTDTAAEARIQELERQLAEAEARGAEFAARESRIADAERAERQRDLTRFVDELVDEGRVLPKDRSGLVAFVAGLDEDVLEFAAGDGIVRQPALEWFRGWLKEQPKRVEYAEFAGAGKGMPPPADDVETEAKAIAAARG